MDLGEYQAFVTSVEQGTITAAAAALGVSRPTLSRHLAALETRLGLALLHRSTRRVQPTPAGQRLYEQVRPLLADLSRVESTMRDERDDVAGLLRVSVPPVLSHEVARLLVGLTATHPRLEVDLIADIRRAELKAERVDVAVRAGRVGDRSLVRRRLGSSDLSAVASPRYLARHGAIETLDDLERHRLLRGHGADGRAQRWWPLRDGERIPVGGSFVCNDQRSLLEAALVDGGVALLSEVTAGAALADGRLVRVLPAELGTILHLSAVFARRTLQPARVRVFVDALAAWFVDGAI